MRRSVSAIAVATLLLSASLQADELPVVDRAVARHKMTVRIDELLNAHLATSGVEPAPLAADAEFLRRAALDLVGVIPRVADARQFLENDSPRKREELIERLLASPAHATHLANTWRGIMLPGGVNLEQANNIAGVQNWLRQRFSDNVRYDNLVSELLVATEGDAGGPALFYTSLELAPDKLAANTARIFLGLQIECAQCHDHPFDSWKQADFWGYAAFFAQLQRPRDGQPGTAMRLVDLNEGEVMLPNSQTPVPPKYIGGAVADSSQGGSRRMQLAIWMASRDNPYLARAAVNRIWAVLFGRGLVEPVDDLSLQNPPSHPQLFAELTDYFIESGFDLRELIRTLALTQAYQRTSRWTAEPLPAPELFACAPVKMLTAEQLYDSLNRTLGRKGESMLPGQAVASSLFDGQRQAFLVKMQTLAKSPLEYHAGVLQALTMLNGADTAEATDGERGTLLGALEAPFMTDKKRIETLYLATLSRFPEADECELCLEHLKATGESDRAKGLADVLWSLLNSAEFAVNH